MEKRSMNVRFGRRRIAAIALAAACVVPRPGAAQPSPAATSGWQDGFFIQSSDGAYRLTLGLVAQGDGRYVDDESATAATDTFTVRKLRPALGGRIARYFDFLVVPDFGNGVVVVQDAFLDVRFSSAFRVRMGKTKTPIGYEILVSDPFLLFPERTLVSSLMPNRDVGVQLLGDVAGGRVSYGAGLYNGIPDGTSSTADVDTNGSKDLAARFVLQPFRSPNGGMSSGLGFAIGGSRGSQVAALPSFRTSVGRRFFSYDAAAAATGTRTRIQPTVFYYHGPFGAFTEFARSTQEIRRSGSTTDVSNEAWGITASWVLTGEATSERGVRPGNTFDPSQGDWGALQLVARYSALDFDDRAFSSGVAAPGSSHSARQITVGFNWYPSAFIKYYAVFERTTFGAVTVPVAPENAVIVRAQVAF
jgi:phosphate-selective porin OprO and OprP